ncbi:extracellular dioxygenase [Drepanopeziza brunnea f. sp. 'multigermtubi' MB_m1]|uniref:Extracellular dioxygenase n=1 Tax=Marssonina brunnea f. sp. multigermtubi (strain MB_m1) TaxID=1072389 RepID=K1WUD5_MARBU|nr:extracellular dioxygenase [Drepanopeziza brunnea f. sp. 'multigermtubi' MB_m1]EKD16062.1 extracellular dioxygenase [Drepanopeziza brunnea f. sp. 'multigermtubi' MB_m1]
MQLIASLIAAAALASNVVAHPGHDIQEEIAERAAFMQFAKKDLSHCAAKLKARGMDKSNVARRAALARNARKKRSIQEDAPYMRARDLTSVLATSHLSSEAYDNSTEASILFSGNSSCILSPEVTQGPYYVAGEYVRKDITEDQEGIDLLLDTQVIDVKTCDPVPDAMIEIWHCNATGVYSGVVANGNGDSSDLTNLNATFLRGLQPTDAEGVAQFATLFPGHYTSRATHIHVLAHFNGTQYANGTYSGGYVSHVGQLFFDQDLITQADTIAPYSSNTQAVTLNSADQILSEEAATTDPVVEYSLLGSSIADGIFGWVAFGIDLTSEQSISAAANLYAEGGVASTSSGGMGGGAPGNGTGGPPSGSPPGMNSAALANSTSNTVSSSSVAASAAATGPAEKSDGACDA